MLTLQQLRELRAILSSDALSVKASQIDLILNLRKALVNEEQALNAQPFLVQKRIRPVPNPPEDDRETVEASKG